MGKTRKPKRRFAANADPIGNIALGDDLEVADGSSSGPIEAIREQVLNANLEEKLNGLQSMTVLINDKEKRAAICSSDIIRIIAPFLCSADLPVRNATAGALRNLSVCSPEICEFLVTEDVLTPLLTLLNEYIVDAKWVPTFDASMDGQLDIRSDVFLQSVNLLWNLCESTEVALNCFNEAHSLEGIIRCLDYNVYGMEIAISVAQCLLVVTENNPRSWGVINSHLASFLQLLEITGGNDHLYLRTLASGILTNVPALAASYSTKILSSLSSALDIHCSSVLTNLMGSLPQDRNGRVSPEMDVSMEMTEEMMNEESEHDAAVRRRREDLPSETQKAFRDVGYLVDAQRVAAEVISNLCSSDEEDGDSSDEETASESDVIIEDDEDIDQSGWEDTMSTEMIEAVKSLDLVKKLWAIVQPLPDKEQRFVRENNAKLFLKLKNSQISTLICLQNLCTVMSTEDLGGSTALYNVWVKIGEQVFKNPSDPMLLEPSTALMRSALEHLKKNKELFNQMAEADLQLLLDGVSNCSIPEIRANWLRMLGTLGCLLPEKLVKTIIIFIVETCRGEEDCWTISESLDALMDMFADNDWTEIVKELNLPEVLGEFERVFKNKLRGQRRELKERYPAAQTVKSNFSRFVVYLQKEAAKSA